MKYILILAFIVAAFASCKSVDNVDFKDDFESKINKLVLSESKVNQEFFFSVPQAKGVLEYRISFLGTLQMKDGEKLFFLNNTILTGLDEGSKRASATVNIYNRNSRKIGFYYVGGVNDLPQGIKDGSLVFDYKNDRCNVTTKINFFDSIPRQIFVGCTKDGGDFYSFAKD